MGGGHHFHYPKWVWSPSGGWWPTPPNASRNAAIYGVFALGVSAWLWQFGNKRTVAYYPKVVERKSHDEGHGGHH